MLRSEVVLQLCIILATASIISLFIAKIYPIHKLFAKDKKVEYQLIYNRPLDSLRNQKTRIPPTAITIPSLNLHLPVAEGVIVGNEWTLYDDKVSWLATSKSPNEGNVILYAHNRINLFGNLRYLKFGEEIRISQGDKITVYTVTDKRNIIPTDVDAIVSNKNQLTLYTCDGTFDQKRLVIIAHPKSI